MENMMLISYKTFMLHNNMSYYANNFLHNHKAENP